MLLVAHASRNQMARVEGQTPGSKIMGWALPLHGAARPSRSTRRVKDSADHSCWGWGVSPYLTSPIVL